MESYLSAGFDSSGQSDFVGIFKVGADGDALCKTGDFDAKWLQNFGDIKSGGFPFDVGVGGHYNFAIIARFEPRKQFFKTDIVGASVCQWGDGAVKDVIVAMKISDSFHNIDVLRRFYHTQNFAETVATDGTNICL